MRQILPILLVALLAGCGTAAEEAAAPTPTPRPVQAALERPTYTVAKGTVVDEIKVNGTVAAVRQQDLSFTRDGFLKTVFVDRTSVITAGQVLAELDLGDLPNQVRQAEVNLAQAQNALEIFRERQAFATRRAEIDLQDAQATLANLTKVDPVIVAHAQRAVESAKLGLEETRTKVSAAKTQAELALRSTSQALPLTQTEFARISKEFDEIKDDPQDYRYQGLYEAYLAAERALRQAEAAVTEANLALETARRDEVLAVRRAESLIAAAEADLKQTRVGPRAEQLASARRAVARAQIVLDEARQAERDTGLEAALAAAQLESDRLSGQLEGARLVAPFAGKVAAVGALPGEAVSAYKAVITVMDDTQKELLVESISSEDTARIGVGQPVTISFSRAPGETFAGIVTQLPTSATSSSSTINPDRAYHIEYTAPNLDLSVGDIGQVTITLEKVDDAIWLPPQAVRTFEGRRFVVVKDGERQRRQDVRVGIISTERIEILDGLKEGDIVVGQ